MGGLGLDGPNLSYASIDWYWDRKSEIGTILTTIHKK